MPHPFKILQPNPRGLPPKLQTEPPVRLLWVMAVGGGLLLSALLFRFNPAEHAFYPRCLFHQITGWHCPGCGGLRAIHQLLHGHLLAALHLNGLAVFSLPLFAGLLWREFAGRHCEATGRRAVSRRLLWGFVGALLVFTVLRNLPAFAFLSP